MDLDPETRGVIRSSPTGHLFRPDNFVFGPYGTGGNWAQGHFTSGVEPTDQALDVVRREAEGCDYLSGFQITHSLGGGTGGGMSALLISKLREEFPDRIIATFSILPSPSIERYPIEPYNAALSICGLVENADTIFCFDNHALYDIYKRTRGQDNPSYGGLNQMISAAISGITTCFRYPGQLNSDLRKLAVNMVPSPSLQFLTVGFSPLTSAGSPSFEEITIQELTQRLFDHKGSMTTSDLRNGRFLNCLAIL